MTNKSTKTLMWVLIAVIVVLLLVLVYLFFVGPAYSNFVAQQQTAGAEYGYQVFYSQLISQLQQTGYVQIPYGNQSIILAPVQQPPASAAPAA